ncbi:glutathione S-transferase family protein [Henriciella marina]|uniref:glutathione S-transferase family protein n=1 Tax=Henriciella marina TaxID=453851 RepID=UPI00035E07B0|nr:glutathione S-transferase family protein [Henriciella marina]
MPVSDDADIELFVFDWVPEMARGHVRDLRPRWAMEEAGIPYRTTPVRVGNKGDYLDLQPYGQVPAMIDNGVRVFESGAILLHLAEKSETLMPRDPAGRAATQSWLLCALNSIESFYFELFFIDAVYSDAAWAKEKRPIAEDFLRKRLQPVSDALGARDWLAGPFTVADIAMATVLRDISGHLPMEDFPTLDAYLKRCLARPAFQRALDAQMADFTGSAPAGFNN